MLYAPYRYSHTIFTIFIVPYSTMYTTIEWKNYIRKRKWCLPCEKCSYRIMKNVSQYTYYFYSTIHFLSFSVYFCMYRASIIYFRMKQLQKFTARNCKNILRYINFDVRYNICICYVQLLWKILFVQYNYIFFRRCI